VTSSPPAGDLKLIGVVNGDEGKMFLDGVKISLLAGKK